MICLTSLDPISPWSDVCDDPFRSSLWRAFGNRRGQREVPVCRVPICQAWAPPTRAFVWQDLGRSIGLSYPSTPNLTLPNPVLFLTFPQQHGPPGSTLGEAPSPLSRSDETLVPFSLARALGQGASSNATPLSEAVTKAGARKEQARPSRTGVLSRTCSSPIIPVGVNLPEVLGVSGAGQGIHSTGAGAAAGPSPAPSPLRRQRLPAGPLRALPALARPSPCVKPAPRAAGCRASATQLSSSQPQPGRCLYPLHWEHLI